MANSVKFKYGSTTEGKTVSADDFVAINAGFADGGDANYGSIYKGDKILGTTCADHLKTTEKIEIVGGPLANDIAESNEVWPWTEDGKKIIPAGKSVQEILEAMFLKVVNGTVKWGNASWSPGVDKPSVALSTNGPVEVGSKVKVSTLSAGAYNNAKRQVTLTTTQGYFDSNDAYASDKSKTFYTAASTVSGTATLTTKWNNSEVTITTNSTELEVVEGTNTLSVSQSGQTATVDALPAMTVYASTNTKVKLPTVSASFSDTKPKDQSVSNSNSDTIVGSYKYFIGTVKGVGLTYDNDLIRGLNTKSAFVTTITDTVKGTEVLATVDIPANGYTTVIAVPEGYTIKQILKLGNDGKGAWTNNGAPKTTATITLDNGDTKVYNIFYAQNEGGAVSSFTNLKIGK